MANSLKVPIQTTAWFSYTEMRSVFDLLYDENCEQQYEGLARIAVWRARWYIGERRFGAAVLPAKKMGEKLPMGVDVTAIIIRAILHDKECQDAFELGHENRHTDVTLIYSIAFIRFVNLITELGQWNTLAEAISTVARRMGLPTWLVELRHEAAHRTMPTSLSVLRAGAKLALDWIREYFWEKTLSRSTVPKKERKFREKFLEIQQYLYELSEMEKKKRATVSFLRRNILYLKCRIDENPKTYIGITLEEGYLMCSQEQLKLIIGEGDIDNDSYVQGKLTMFWLPFLQYFHAISWKTLMIIVSHLMFVLEEGVQSEHYLHVAKLWMRGILQFLKSINAKVVPEIAMDLMTKALLNKCETIKETIPLLYAVCKPHLLESDQQKIGFVMDLDTEKEPASLEACNIETMEEESECSSDDDPASKESALECAGWQLCSEAEMKLLGEVPCGVLPNQIFTDVPDLKLPRFVDKFSPSFLDDGTCISIFEKARTNPDGMWSSGEMEKMEKLLAWI